MQVIIEWFDENHRTLYRRTSEDWLRGEERGELVITPVIPKFEYTSGGEQLTKHAHELIAKHFTDKIVGVRVRVLPDGERLGVGDL